MDLNEMRCDVIDRIHSMAIFLQSKTQQYQTPNYKYRIFSRNLRPRVFCAP